MSGPLPRLALVGLLVALSSGTAQAVTFADGGQHTIDANNSFPAEGVQILDGPGPTATRVDVVGGVIGTVNGDDVDVSGSSRLTVFSGEVGGQVRGFDDAVIGIGSGSLGGAEMRGASHLQITPLGTTLIGDVTVLENAVIEVSSGELGDLLLGDDASGVLAGGVLDDVFVEGSATLEAIGLSDDPLDGPEPATVSLLEASGTARVVISSIELSTLEVRDTAAVEVRGQHFEEPPVSGEGEVQDLEGTLSGLLEDGRPFSWAFVRDPLATITLVVSPASVSLDQVGVFHQPSGAFLLRRADYELYESGEIARRQQADTTAYIALGPGWLPVAGDWDGDGEDGLGVYNTETGAWFLVDVAVDSPVVPLPADYSAFIATDGANWLPITGDWDGDGRDGIGIYSKTSGTLFLVDDPTQGASAASPADYTVFMTVDGADWIPIAGDWDGDGQDGVAIYNKTTGVSFFANDVTVGGSAATFLPGEINSWVAIANPPTHTLAGRWRDLEADGNGYQAGDLFSLVTVVTDGPDQSDLLINLDPPPGWGSGSLNGPDYLPLAGAWSVAP